MATEAQLVEALRKADAAGDESGASRIAQIIQEQRQAGVAPVDTVANAPQPQADQSPLGQVNDRIQAFAQGASLGVADNVGAALESLRMLPDDDTFGEDKRGFGERLDDFWDSTQELTANRKAQREQFSSDNPGEALMWELAGGLMMPAVGGTKLGVKGADTAMQAAAKTAAIGGLEGAIYGAATADGDPMLENIAKNAAFGLGGGALMGGAAKKIGNAVKARKKVKADTAAHKAVDEADVLLAAERAKRPDASDSEIIQMAERNMTDVDKTRDALTASGRQYHVPSDAEARIILGQEAALRNATTPNKWLEKAKGVGSVLDDLAGAVSTRVRKADQGTFNLLMKHDFNTHTKTQDYMKRVKGLDNLNKARHSANKPVIKKLLINDRYDEAIEVARKTGDQELTDGLIEAKSVFRDIRKQLEEVNYSIPDNGDYFARVVKDVNKLRQKLGRKELSALDEAKRNWAKRTGKPIDRMTDREEANLINTVLRTGSIGGKGGQLGSSKQRTLKFVADDLMDEYQDPAEAIGEYVRRSVEDIEERRFFGKHAKGGSGSSNIDVNESVGGYLSDKLQRGEIDQKQFDELQRLLSVRFGSGKVGPGKFMQNVKNIGLMSALGNFKAAGIQVADLGHSVYMNNLKNTAQALGAQIRGKAPLSVSDIGLDNIIQQEFNSMGKTARGLDKMLQLSGFKKIDQIGKTTFINSAFNKATKMAQSAKGRQALEKKWGGVFEDEFPQLIEDLQNGAVTDNTKLMAWHELSGVQPISLSETPLKYMEMENGRLFWALKSFALKQLDIMRRNVVQKAASGDRFAKSDAALDLLKYAAITGGSTHVINEARQGLFSGGADPVELNPDDFSDSIVWHMLAMTGLVNKYNTEKLAKSGDVHDVLEGILPPLGLLGAAVGDTAKTLSGNGVDNIADSQVAKALPGVGGFVHDFFGGGMEKKQEAARKRKLEK